MTQDQRQGWPKLRTMLRRAAEATSYDQVGAEIGVSGPQVHAWVNKGKSPSDKNLPKVERWSRASSGDKAAKAAEYRAKKAARKANEPNEWSQNGGSPSELARQIQEIRKLNAPEEVKAWEIAELAAAYRADAMRADARARERDAMAADQRARAMRVDALNARTRKHAVAPTVHMEPEP